MLLCVRFKYALRCQNCFIIQTVNLLIFQNVLIYFFLIKSHLFIAPMKVFRSTALVNVVLQMKLIAVFKQIQTFINVDY
jgi:hypothetical protein